MGLEASRTKPTFEKTEHWSSPLSPESVSNAISRAFASEKARIRQNDDLLEVRVGSNWQYRLWGNLFSWSRREVPVALTVRVRAAGEGAHIDAHAFDTFGFRVTDHAFFGADKTFEHRLDVLPHKAAEADVAKD
ncbi:hypothetical protein [Arthrobacter sp. ISL-5]|uniref:hypothetical protein n=1 Tax=Arthrobacter sp. ISL-5 TaxID=2819111 RepID=UPI001BE69B35|nr:hypothetical protein [Arthrobacter sp. ISL-5]MBT2554276.1 hypothetical protein [Arthrobacter sp. ISL-5]